MNYNNIYKSNSHIIKMDKKNYYLQFNDSYFKFLDFLKDNSNENKEFKSYYAKNLLMKQTNIKYFIKTWYSYITVLYYDKIMNNDISFFLNKDFTSDKKKIDNSYSTTFDKSIEYLKIIYTKLDKNIIDTFLIYIKNLTHYSYLYYK